MTVTLLASGALLIAFSEWTNQATLGSLDTGDKALAAMFQSATARTAGFNTVAIRGCAWPACWC